MEISVLKEYFFEKKMGEFVLGEKGNIKIDSRKVESGDIFVAIRGEKNDANNFADDIFAKGAALIVTDKEETKIKYQNKALMVKDAITFLQDFSSYYRDKINPIVVGITGSNGKTTTKDFLFSILSRCGRTKKTMGNLNNHIGVPLTLLQLEKGDEYIVVEMGMSGFGEIDRLCQISKPDYGIITNIGDSHMEYMKTKENVFIAKTEMVKHVKNRMILNGDDEFLKKIEGISVGLKEECDFKGDNIVIDENGSKFQITTEKKMVKAEIQIAGEHNILDALLAAAAAAELGINDENIVAGLKETEFTKMRFEKIAKGNTVYINDAYNASPVSMRYAIETFSEIYNDGFEKIAVLGDMLELGEKSKEYHEAVFDTVISAKIDKIYLFGNEMKHLYKKLDGVKAVTHFTEKSQIKESIKSDKDKKAILLKGSRGMKLEDIID